MSEEKKLPEELLTRISQVSNKRARVVLDGIVANGIITTEEINKAGYDHPPRAAQDAKDLGFRLKRVETKHSNGHSIAGYTFDTQELEAQKSGRRLLPKKERDLLIQNAGYKCQICGAKNNLQVDHRIPYEVAGESQQEETDPYQILCGSCNRKKSWACEHCQNVLQNKELDICRSCYWAEPDSFTHVAMQEQRRVDLVWIGDEVANFDKIKTEANSHGRSVQQEIKETLKQ